MMEEETHPINDVVVEESPINNKAAASSSSSKEEAPNIVNIVSQMVTKKTDEPDENGQVVEEVKKLEEEPKKGQVVVEENKKKEDEESTVIQQVLVPEEPEKKGGQKDAAVKDEKDVEKSRQVVEDQEPEKKLVLEEPKTREVDDQKEDKQIGGESKSSSVVAVEPEGGEQPNKTDEHVVMMEKKISNQHEETKAGGGGGGDQEPAAETGRSGEKEEGIQQDVVESTDSSLVEVEKSSSFKEENKVAGGTSDLKEHEKKALNELKSKIEEAILENKFLIKKKDEVVVLLEKDNNDQIKPIDEEKVKPVSQEEKEKTSSTEVNETTNEVDKKEEKHTKEEEEEEVGDQEKKNVTQPNGENDKKSSNVSVQEKSMEIVSVERDISLWGVPLLPSKGSEATNVILLKFLRARDFKVNEAFEMVRNTIQWRKDFKIDSILDEDFGSDLSSVAYMDGLDREGHPICYNMYGIFEDNELYQKTFGTEEKREQFLRWRYQLMEKGIQKLDFNSGGVTSLLQINDLKNSPGPSKKELRVAMKQAVALLQDNYPEFVARNIFVNVPFWYYAFNAVLSPFLTQRTKSKFVFARPSKVTETLLRYIPAEQVPIRYGGLKRDNDSEFITDEESVVTELAIKAGLTETIEIPAPEVGTTILWDLAVLGWEVNYKAEFVPNDEGSYTIIVQKLKKMGLNEEPVRNSFKSNEPGKIILSIENGTYKKKRAFYRFKTHN